MEEEEEEVDEERRGGEDEEEEEEDRLVCVTSGISYLGIAVVDSLLKCGYSVRVAVDKDEDLEKMREMEIFGEWGNGVSAVTSNLTDVKSLCEAFNGCRGVFHTSAFADPSGVSGYTKCMADLEVKASESVLEACARTESVKKCIFTSSLLACIWHNNNTLSSIPTVLDHKCWSDESVCRDKKLWFALGKTLAEKAAWRVAKECDMKLVTICPGLVTGPDFCRRNPTATIAYLKGVREMYTDGLLATIDVARVADAHVRVYKAMKNRASGRYICFDNVIKREEQAVEFATQLEMHANRILGDDPTGSTSRFILCNKKLSKLVSRPTRCSSFLRCN
ncbi:hypothetical protein Scep_021300 [Stephania cephalantha]|uniref:3-beta hydroxysteroid dehydrogenase/isomerase domain-containing protein n=1 Tax=Stephania cephalantha TaxID=152367 RepID=A0AAP0F4C6_9MAGN